MTRSKNKSAKSQSRNLSQNKLRVPIEAIVKYSKRLMHDENLAKKEIKRDLNKINALGEQLLKLFDNIITTRKKRGKRADDFLSELSSQTIHDLRTPLNAIIGFSELLREDFEGEMIESSIINLQKILSSAKEFLSELDNSVKPSVSGISGPDLTSDASYRDKMIKATMDSIPQPVLHQASSDKKNKGLILVVDDNEVNRDLLSSQLERQGHSVTLATSGREALEIMRKEPIDLVLLDIMMPEMNGFQVLEHISSNPKMGNMPVIVISALDKIDSVVQCIQMGAEDYLLKPFNPVLLNTRIDTCLEKKRLIELCKTLELNNLKEDVQFIAESPAMQSILHTVRTVCRNPVNILLYGNSGTGKEVIARMIHNGGDRKDMPFIPVNCAAIPENLMESEFFGYEKGAFTGASASRGGYFEEANGGTLFLDEIGDMPMFIQPKFMRAIQEGEGRRLGGNKSIAYDLRIISATNKDLRKEVAGGRFRKDLYYRIFSVEINIPPLHERREDIVPLAIFFLNKVGKRFNKKVAGYSPNVLRFFEKYPWPGNVRQLLHEVERLVAFTPEGAQVSLKHGSPEILDWKKSCSNAFMDNNSRLSMPDKIKELEIECINDALRQTKGKKLPAAKLLGITRGGLDNKIKRYGITYSSKISGL
ncbi:MAG: sigma 54-interacting transcriptional regulator [Thermodesulfobacteriota bacterium]